MEIERNLYGIPKAQDDTERKQLLMSALLRLNDILISGDWQYHILEELKNSGDDDDLKLWAELEQTLHEIDEYKDKE